MKRRNISGRRFGRLFVISTVEQVVNGLLKWECLCDCGKTTFVSTAHLVSGSTLS
jgi:hypothetical protein